MKYLYSQDQQAAHRSFLIRVGALAPKSSWRQRTPAPSGNKKGGKKK